MIFTGKVGEQMKNIKFYNQKIKCSNSEVFDYIIGNLKETIKGWDYFVDWAKIFGNVDKIEVSLNIMNYLIGKSNIEEEFKKLLKEYPEIVTLIPILVACRDGELTVLILLQMTFLIIKLCLKKRPYRNAKLIHC